MANDGVKIGAAMAAGYLIGRTRKARLALALVGGALVAGRGLMGSGLGQSRLGGVLVEVLGDVERGAGRALTARAERFTDSLHERTLGLRNAVQPEGEEQSPERGEEDQGAESETQHEPDQAASDEEPEPEEGEGSEGGREPRRSGERVAAGAGGRDRERRPAAQGRR
jgi:hypothetical protein